MQVKKKCKNIVTVAKMKIMGACFCFFNGLVVDNEFMPPIKPFLSKSTHARSSRGENKFEVQANTECKWGRIKDLVCEEMGAEFHDIPLHYNTNQAVEDC